MGLCCASTIHTEYSAQTVQEQFLTDVNITDSINTYRFGRTLTKSALYRIVEATNTNNINGIPVNIKIFNKNEENANKLYNRELNILQTLCSDNTNGILTYIAHGQDKYAYYIVTKRLCGDQLLDSLISTHNNEKTKARLIRNILQRVKYCHDKGIIHRNITPEKFVFENNSLDSDLYLIDFSAAQLVTDDEIIENMEGDSLFIAPELAVSILQDHTAQLQHITGAILKASEVWSIGIIAYIIMTGKPPFRGKNRQQILEAICLKPLLFPQRDTAYHHKIRLSEHFRDFIRLILVKDPLKRICIEDALRHPWVQAVMATDAIANNDVRHDLRQFCYRSKFRKVMNTAPYHEQCEDIRIHFDRLDADGDGYLCEKELEHLLADTVGYCTYMAKAKAYRIIHMNTAGVDFEEFRQHLFRLLLSRKNMCIHKLFDVFDKDGKGAIDVQLAMSIVCRTNDNIENEDVVQQRELAKMITDYFMEYTPLSKYVVDIIVKEYFIEETDDDKIVFCLREMLSDAGVNWSAESGICFDEFEQAFGDVNLPN